MKKLLLFLSLLILPQFLINAHAIESGAVLNLHTNESYILDLKQRPKDIQNSNPRIVKAESVTEIFTTDSNLIITTYEEGIAYITFKLNEKNTTIKLLIDDKADEDKGLLKLDKPENEIKH
ncbi:MAG: hypothetical protein KHX03_08960 [Clostridium sp.]|nr:hypothetical protein [Clostridium sp.]